MKKMILLMSALFTMYHPPADGTLNKKERKFAVNQLEASMQKLFKNIEGMSEAQWNYTPADGGWSVAGACEHLLVAEQSTYALITQKILPDESLKEVPSTLMTDQQVIDFIRDRSPERRVKTAPRFEPKGLLKSPADFKAKFKEARQKHIEFAQESDDAVKSYFFDSPAGKISAYQWLLVASAHSERHLAQMKEVMKDSAYPKQLNSQQVMLHLTAVVRCSICFFNNIQMKKLLTLVLLTAFLCSCQQNLEEQLVGSWQNVTLNVQMNTAQGQDTTTYLVVEEGQWEEVLEIKPILTTFLADGTFTSEYFGLDGKPMGTEAGEWSVKKDSLIMFSEAYTGSYKVILNGDRVRFISYLDWDQDGAPDDLYDGWQERVTR